MMMCVLFLILNVVCAAWNLTQPEMLNAILACINSFVAGLLATTIVVSRA
jgi:hypothetical protein